MASVTAIDDNDVEIPQFTITVRVDGQDQGAGAGQRKSAIATKLATLDEILSDARETPFSRRDFRTFLVKRRVEELLDFFINAVSFKDVVLGKTKNVDKEAAVVKKSLPNVSTAQDPTSLAQMATDIAKEFVMEGSPKEVNISSDQRIRVLQALSLTPSETDSDGEKVPLSSIFDESVNEVKQLLYVNTFEEFIKLVSTTNISVPESHYRLKKSAIFLPVIACILVPLIWAEFHYPGISHFYRLLVLPLVFAFFMLFNTYRTRVCVICARHGKTYAICDTTEDEAEKLGTIQTICDQYARSRLLRLGLQNVARSVVFTILTMGVILAIPPYTNF